MTRQFTIEEADRQMIIRGLAVQSLRSPGFKMACRLIAANLQGTDMFDNFCEVMADVEPPRP